MKAPTSRRQYGLRFNITPLIDVVFLLIIFFLAASHFVRSESYEAVALPEATQGEDEEQQPKRLVVTVTAEGRMHAAGQQVTQPEVESMVAEGAAQYRDGFAVRIRADRSVPYEVVEPIMIACARAGVTRVKFAVITE